MKKILVLLMVAMMTISMVACGEASTSAETSKEETNNSEDTTVTEENSPSRETTSSGDIIYYVGEEISSDYFPFTVKEAVFTERVSTKPDEFLTPTTDTGSGTYNTGDKDYQWLYYEVEYTYSGKSTLSLVTSLFKPTVYYGEYNFSSDYFTFGKIDNSWYIFSNDYDGVGHPFTKDLSSNGWFKFEPLDDTVYIIRGVIKVPTKAIEDTETPIYLRLLNVSNASASAIDLTGYCFEIER